MKLSKQEVEHLAELAHLRLTDEETARYGDQMSSILEYVGKLQTIEAAAAALSGTDAVNVLREDKVEACDQATRDGIVKNFPKKNGDSLQVPAVFGDRPVGE